MRPRTLIAALVVCLACAGVGAPAVAAAAGVQWRWPVDGGVSRAYSFGPDPYAAGAHRGVDLAAAPGTLVRSACAGRVAFAGALPDGAVAVTVACGPWRATHLPVSSAVRVAAGDQVRVGEALGRLAGRPAHDGLHFGVRRAGNRHGYVDPARLLAAARPFGGAPPIVGGRGPRGSGRASPPVSVVARARPERDAAAAAAPPALAPAPVWAGLALVLLGGVGAGASAGGRRHRARRTSPVSTSEEGRAVGR